MFIVLHKCQYLVNMPTKNDKLGSRIKRLRKELSLTQEQLAEKAKMEARSIIDIEAGKRNPTLKTISNIAKALNTSAANLLDN